VGAYHGAVGDGEHVDAEVRVARQALDGTGEQPTVRVQPNEVDGEPLG